MNLLDLIPANFQLVVISYSDNTAVETASEDNSPPNSPAQPFFSSVYISSSPY